MESARQWPIAFTGAGLLAFALGAALLLFGGWAEQFGAHLPVVDATGDYAVALAWALFLGLTIVLWPVPERDKPHLLALWVAKILVVLLPMLVYEAHYGVLDAYDYYATPQRAFAWTAFELTAGTGNMYRLVWLHGWLGPDSYHAAKLSFAMVGLLAIYVFYRGIALHMNRASLPLLYALALFPSILFWSSILGKDPIVLLGIALYLYGLLASWRRGRWALPPLATGLVILTYFRIWLVPILLVAAVPLLLSGRWSVGRRLLALLAMTAVGVAAAQQVSEVFVLVGEDLPSAIGRISQAWADDGGSGQYIGAGFSGYADLARFAPLGAFTALFRPLPGEVPNLFGLLAGLENAVLLALAALALLRLRARDLRDPVVLAACLLVGTWAAVYGFVSYQNLGTAVRFKVQILPVMLCLLLHLARGRRLYLVGWLRPHRPYSGAQPC